MMFGAFALAVGKEVRQIDTDEMLELGVTVNLTLNGGDFGLYGVPSVGFESIVECDIKAVIEGEGSWDLYMYAADDESLASPICAQSNKGDTDSIEQCVRAIPADFSVVVGLEAAAYVGSQTVQLVCIANPIDQLSVGEDVVVRFDNQEAVNFIYESSRDALESLFCRTAGPNATDEALDFLLFSQDENFTLYDSCQALNVICRIASFAGPLAFITIFQSGAATYDEVVLTCEVKPIEELPLGVPVTVTIESPDVEDDVIFSVTDSG